ncbi:MAG TPA: hypothetical protein VJY64_01470 [Candidatus Onthovivens sp.]|nr:hypothetical protein [Candidatus Onthovivens sp.]
MKINLLSLKENESFEYIEDLSLLNNINSSSILKKFLSVKGTIDLVYIDDVLTINFKLNCLLEVLSSYTYEPFEYALKVFDSLSFTNKKEMETDDIILIEKSFELEPLIYSLVLTLIPTNAHKKGEKLPKTDEYAVLTEDEYNEELKKETGNSFDILKDIDFDE